MRLELIGLQPVRCRKIRKPARLRVEARQAIVGTHPKPVMIVFQDSKDNGAGQAIPRAVNRKMPRLAIEQIQPVRRTDPEIVPAVCIDIVDGIVAQAVLARYMDKMLKDPRILVEPVEAP